MNKITYTDDELDLLAYIKKTIPHHQPPHHNPLDYGLTQEEALKLRLRYLNRQLAYYRKKYDEFQWFLLNGDSWFVQDQLVSCLDLIQATERKRRHITRLLRSPTKLQQSFDLYTLKQIPIDTFVEVSSRNTFKLRDEKTASCYWYKNTNRWQDFGTDEGGDVIDLVMKLNQCSFYEACKYLSNT